MIRISAIDAVMIYADDPAALSQWYATHLGIPTERNPDDGNYYAHPGVKDADTGHVVRFGIYPREHRQRGACCTVMINYRVEDFDAALTHLRAHRIAITSTVEEAYGRFAYLSDPEGNPIEIWSERR